MSLPGTSQDFSMSTVSLTSIDSQQEDWDRSEADMLADEPTSSLHYRTPRNSVAFPATHGDDEDGAEGVPNGRGRNKRSLSELLRIHAEKGTDCVFSAEEAARLAEVLGAWINSASSPYEGEDDFFAKSHDDMSLSSKRGSPSASSSLDPTGRQRGQSESIVTSRPSSALAQKA